MEEFWNILIALIVGIIAGLALHSGYRHTFNGEKKR